MSDDDSLEPISIDTADMDMRIPECTEDEDDNDNDNDESDFFNVTATSEYIDPTTAHREDSHSTHPPRQSAPYFYRLFVRPSTMCVSTTEEGTTITVGKHVGIPGGRQMYKTLFRTTTSVSSRSSPGDTA